MMAGKYTSESIKVLSGLDGVRKNPSMYIGSTDGDGLFLILRELMDNVVDEFIANRSKVLKVAITDSGYWAYNDGPGIPQGIKKINVHVSGKDVISKVPTMQAIFGMLHTSGKQSEAYKRSVGVHGVGAKGSNALSDKFQVWTNYKDEWHHIGFSKGKLKTKGVVSEKPPKSPFGKIKEGTLIYFEPDFSIFSAKKFKTSMLKTWAEIASYLNPKFRILISYKGKEKEYYSKEGPSEFLEKRIKDLGCEEISKAMFDYKSELADVVVKFTTLDGSSLEGFTNGLKNNEGGTHVNTVYSALFKEVKKFAKKKEKVTLSEFKEGIVGIVNAKLSGAKFSSQAKVKLTDERMDSDFAKLLEPTIQKFFKKHKKLARLICVRCTKLSEVKSKFKASKKVLQELNKVKRIGMPAKYAPYQPSSKVEDRELFIVEGDSAAGKIKGVRGPNQAILPLKGKILNVLKPKGAKALESKDVIYILGAMGFDPKAKDPYAKLQTNKIICFADPDPDGPFVGNTPIQIIDGGNTGTYPIEDLIGKQFHVMSYDGLNAVPKPATALHVKDTKELIQIQIGKSKYQTDPDHKWALAHYRTYELSEGTITKQDGLHYKCSKDLKAGDRIISPYSKSKDLSSGIPFEMVSKTKKIFLDKEVPVYCLNVKDTHNFILPGGHVSSNCHINTLLLTLFYKYMPKLFDLGKIYVMDAPEFYAYHKDDLVSGDTVSEVQKQLKKLKAKANTPIRHIKGWGEVNERELLHFAINKETRKLIRITYDKESDKDFTRLMNEDVNFRRELIGI